MSLRIVFMGTPEFAVPSLDILVQNGYQVVAVVTATDKWGGRGGKQLLQSAVKTYAVAKGIPILQPEKLRDADFVAALRSYAADLQIVVAFRMLPEVVWAMPRLGTFNLHGSLLPKYRGAAPINWAIIRGDAQTGVSTFFLQQEIDTGDLIFQETLPIAADETAGTLHDRMMVLGAATVLKTVRAIEADAITPLPQDHSQATAAPKLNSDNTHVTFDQPTWQVDHFIRGLSPFPGAWAWLHGEKWKLLNAHPIVILPRHPAGTIVSDGRTHFDVATADGYVRITALQMPGKRRMSIADFLNGWRMPEGELAFG